MKETAYTKTFERYYHEQFWGNDDGCSGPNSAYDQTPILRENLHGLIQQYQIESIFDAGCGDANLFKHIPLGDIRYTGMDCVKEMIDNNNTYFAKDPNKSFVLGDVLCDAITSCDLIICRDVVHYLPNDLIKVLLENICASHSKYLLITHNTHSKASANDVTEPGVFRPVNLNLAPFCWPDPLTTIKEDIFAKEMALFALNDVS